MFHISIQNSRQNDQFTHTSGALELGRGPQREERRMVIADSTCSRDQLRVEELAAGRVRVKNLSQGNPVQFIGGGTLAPGAEEDVDLPVRISVGASEIVFSATAPPPVADKIEQSVIEPPATAAVEPAPERPERDSFSGVPTFLSIRQSALGRGGASPLRREPVDSLGAEALAEWFERVIDLQQAAAGSPEFYQQTARALVDMIGLDLGLVLLSRNNSWVIAGSHAADDKVRVEFSQTLLKHVVSKRRTFYQDLETLGLESVSLASLEAVVASPIFGLGQDVVGVLYGVRGFHWGDRVGVQLLEAQLVQLIAAAVSANLARTVATRTRVQFEQFFSPELANQLENDPSLLEGRDQEITVLFSDLRGFTALSQRIGAAETCRLMRDIMEQLSERIVERKGTIVDYAGDGILAMWNAPVLQPDHAALACQAGQAMLAELPGLNARWQELANGTLSLGIGINTGMAQVGNTGSSRKFKYGPRGHAVNLASRVQETTKNLRLPLLITGTTQALLPSEYACRRLGLVRLAGVKEATLLYEVKGVNASPEWQERRQVYEAALAHYEDRRWIKACQTLLPLMELSQGPTEFDTPTLKLLRRAWDCLEAPPDSFEPIIEVTNK